MRDEETTTDELLAELVWSRARARRILRRYSPSMFGQYAAVVAIVDDHDRRNPTAPAEGQDRVLSIVAHTMQLREDTTAHPERFTAAASMDAHRRGAPDPALLALARQALTWLPAIVTHVPNARR